MARLRVEGLAAVSRELERIKKAQAPAILKAVEEAGQFGKTAAVAAIFKRYGFNDLAYVEQHFSLSIHPQDLRAVLSARFRPSTLNRFTVAEHYRTGKKGQRVRAGVSVAPIRGETHWFKGAWSFIGRNGNRIMYIRRSGETWRTFKEARSQSNNRGAYGPSVAGSFAVLRDDLEPAIIRHLRERYDKG